MAIKQLTYAELGDVWGVSKEAARKKVEGLRLPRRIGNDGKTRVTIDLEEITHTPKTSKAETDGSPTGDQAPSTTGDQEETERSPTPEVIALRAQISALEMRASELKEDLQAERARTEKVAGELRADIERERSERLQERLRSERLTEEIAALAKRLADVTEASSHREALLRNEMVALQGKSWWRRLVS